MNCSTNMMFSSAFCRELLAILSLEPSRTWDVDSACYRINLHGLQLIRADVHPSFLVKCGVNWVVLMFGVTTMLCKPPFFLFFEKFSCLDVLSHGAMVCKPPLTRSTSSPVVWRVTISAQGLFGVNENKTKRPGWTLLCGLKKSLLLSQRRNK